jgi:hypothetical protein
MSIRLDPRRLAALKLLAAEAGVRPGELVTVWVEERLDAARHGAPSPAPTALADLSARVDELARRLDALTASATTTAPASAAAAPEAPPAPRRRGRPPKARPPTALAAPRVPLHAEIEAVIAERGPLTAAELAQAIKERGRYTAPRSARPLDAATVNSRVSNPVYRARFTRRDGKIGLASSG